MELKDAIYNRRSIRKFKEEEISKETILSIIKDATHAASGHNRQPWKFKILDKKTKNLISDTLYEKYKDVKGHTALHTAEVIKNIPNLVVVYLDSDNCEYRDIDILSIGGMIDEILLLSEEKNIGTLWIANTNLISEEIKKITDVNLETISCIGFGEKDQFPNPRPRKNFEDIIIE